MITFCMGVMKEGLDDEIEEVMDEMGRMKLVECGGDLGSMMEKLRMMNIGESRGESSTGLVWIEKGGEVWERMAEKAEMLAIGEARKERTASFVNTRIIDSKRRMGKRERREMGGWLNIIKFRESEENMCAVIDEQTVEDMPPSDNTDRVGEKDHPVQVEIDEHTVHDCESEESLGGAEEKHNVETISPFNGTCQTVKNDYPVGEEKEEHPVRSISAGEQISHPVEKVPKETCYKRHTVEIENMRYDHPVVDTVVRVMCNPPVAGDKGDDHPVDTGSVLAGGVTDDVPEGPGVPGAVSSAPKLTAHSVDVKQVGKREQNKKTGVKNMIDKYLVKVDMGAAMKIAKKKKDEDRNEHPVERKGAKGVGEGPQSRKNTPSKPGTSTGGGGDFDRIKEYFLIQEKTDHFK